MVKAGRGEKETKVISRVGCRVAGGIAAAVVLADGRLGCRW
jgi:hypothetical protein